VRDGAAGLQREVDTELLVEKEQTIHELRETVEILESKVPTIPLPPPFRTPPPRPPSPSSKGVLLLPAGSGQPWVSDPAPPRACTDTSSAGCRAYWDAVGLPRLLHNSNVSRAEGKSC
jgi:hypothetical protein